MALSEDQHPVGQLCPGCADESFGKYPFVEFEDRRLVRDALLQSYVSARLADLRPALVRKVDRVADSRLVIVPSTKSLLAPTWDALERCVFVTFGSGETNLQRGPWHPDFDRFLGVRRQHRYGLADAVTDDEVVWSVISPFGGLNVGDELRFRLSGTADGKVFIPVDAEDASVLATHAAGRPALVERAVRSGRIVLGTAPVEYFAARTPRVNPDDTVRLYQAIARHACVDPGVHSDDVRILSDVLVRDDGRQWAVFVDQSADAVSATPHAADGQFRDKRRDLESVVIAPYGVSVFEITSDGLR
ncbi:MAG: hypothetical protein ABI775_04595 [Pseudonocardiales bacterium]